MMRQLASSTLILGLFLILAHAGGCASAVRTFGGGDDDGNGGSGGSGGTGGAGGACPGGVQCGSICVDTATDPNNCGACGNNCPSALNANGVCTDGVCSVTCNPSYQDCNADTTDGCETNVGITLTDCGACGNACPQAPNATIGCFNGTCTSTCNAPYDDCNADPSDGCETDLTNSLNNCGACGTACLMGPNGTSSCLNGSCGFVCNASFADCNGNPADGCEVNVANDIANCGACGTACAVGVACNSGICGAFCHDIGYASCPTGATQFCDSSPIVGTNPAQAQLACQTCMGAPCYLENADCAGPGYGPQPPGQYICNDPYWGYTAGCSGSEGRVWSICSSFTTYGMWAN